MISLNIEKTFGFVSKESISAYEAQVKAAQEALENGTCKGNDFLGWLHLPSSITPEHLADLKATAQVLRDNCEVVVAGIGGSYLGARAVIEAMSNSFAWLQEKKNGPVILFAGHNIGEDYLYELTEYLKGKKFGVINISKSGTTTETALAFRLLKKQCEDQLGKEMAKKVIVAITDAKKGAARVTADREGYKSFIIPDNVGGRFSVLTPVGLLPIAVAGFDIEKLEQLLWKRLAALTFRLLRTLPPCTLLPATNCTRTVRKSRYSSTSTPNFTTSTNGGSSCTVNQKVKTERVYSPQPLTSQPTCTLWDNGFRKANVPSTKPLSLSKRLSTN